MAARPGGHGGVPIPRGSAHGVSDGGGVGRAEGIVQDAVISFIDAVRAGSTQRAQVGRDIIGLRRHHRFIERPVTHQVGRSGGEHCLRVRVGGQRRHRQRGDAAGHRSKGTAQHSEIRAGVTRSHRVEYQVAGDRAGNGPGVSDLRAASGCARVPLVAHRSATPAQDSECRGVASAHRHGDGLIGDVRRHPGGVIQI